MSKQKDRNADVNVNPGAVTLEPIDHRSSKEAELTLLHTVRNLFKEGTYLKQLFSEDLLDWVHERIEQDRSCDLFGELHQWQHAMERQAQDYGRTIQEQGNRLHAAMQELEQYQRYNEQLISQIVALRDDLAYAGDLVQQTNAQGLSWYREASNLQQQVNALKACIFDLEHPQWIEQDRVE